MPDDMDDSIILHTKLHRPHISKDHLHRGDLLAKLSRQKNRSLTLVSAPAGYGKSTLVTCWLDDCGMPGSWVSLDQNDSDTRVFLAYFIAAIQQIFPRACSGTLSMLRTAHLPPVAVLAKSLINELDQISDHFILVLDDYHLIRNKNIHQFITKLLTYPTLGMCLVLICRRDPPLPLATLRAGGQMTEIRARDLRFSFSETKQLLQQILEEPVDDAVVAILEDKTEGWVTGLCLAAFSFRKREISELKLTHLQLENRYLMDYVVAEIISQQQPAAQDYLLKCSILNRFCAPLCDAVCKPSKGPDADDLDGSNFLRTLDSNELFVIPLDDEGIWFRYHHLFQTILKRRLKKQVNAEEIARLNKLASTWFADNGYINEAIFHVFESGDNEVSARLVKQFRRDIISREQWFNLDRWLQRFPIDYLRTDPELLLAKAWVYQRQARYINLFKILDEIECLVSKKVGEPAVAHSLWGEIQLLRSFQYYATGQAKLSETTARDALDHLPRQNSSHRGFALLIISAALQMQGSLHLAYQVVHEAMASDEVLIPIYKNMLLVTLCYTSWIAADSKKLKLAAGQTIKHGEENDLPETTYIGRFFFGILCYQQNKLALAESFLSSVGTSPVTDELVIPSIVTYCQSMLALSSTYLAMGRKKEASDVVEAIVEYMFETENVDLLELCQAFQADLTVRMGKIGEAEIWQKNHIQKPPAPSYRFYTADLTPVRILLARRTAETLGEAEKLLSQQYNYNVSIHNTRMLIDILAMQALVLNAQSDETRALGKLMEALALAEPGGFIRPFLDQGLVMAELLGRLLEQKPALGYAGQVCAAFAGNKDDIDKKQYNNKKTSPQFLADDHFSPPLSNREIEVLTALAEGLSNNEIADTLYISTETVKRHLSTIYQKLDVKNRHQAVITGKSIGIL